MATKEQIFARHGVTNGSAPEPDETKFSNEIQGTMAPSEASDRTSGAPIEPPHIILRETAAALDRARFEARQCRAATLEARSAFGKALAAWNASGPAPQDQMALKKEWIASNQRERERKAAAGQGVHYPGVGRTAKALAGGNARNGGGAAYRRGAYTRAEAMTANSRAAAMARAKAAFKPPSER